MTTFPNSPRLLKGGVALLSPDDSSVIRMIALQYNPDTVTRRLEPRAVSAEGDRGEAFRLTGPPEEAMTLKANWKRS
jgi:hypothetical protein